MPKERKCKPSSPILKKGKMDTTRRVARTEKERGEQI